MKRKILIANVHLEIGGIEKTLISLLKKIDYSKYDIDLMLLKINGDLIKEVPKNVNIITPYKSQLLKKIVNSNNIFCKIIKHLLFNYFTTIFWRNKKNYDVAISYGGYYPFIDRLVSRVKSERKYIWVHTNLSVFENSKLFKIRFYLFKNKYKYFNNIVCVSKSIKEIFDNLIPIYKNKTIVRHNIIEIKETKNDIVKIDGDFKILSVGRLTKAKRFDRLIEVHKKLIDNNYNVKTYIAGSGKEYNNLKNQIELLNVSDSIILLGNQKNIIGLMRQADMFILTSDYEGLPTVLFESLYSSLPFVGTNVCGIIDIAKDIAPKNSNIISKTTVDDIYDSIVELINNIDNYKNFKFDLDNYNINCYNDFEELIK